MLCLSHLIVTCENGMNKIAGPFLLLHLGVFERYAEPMVVVKPAFDRLSATHQEC